MNKNHFLFGLIITAFFLTSLLVPTNPAFADSTTLTLPIAPNGDVPAVPVTCTPGHNYTLTLIHVENGVLDQYHNVGAIFRRYCDSGTIVFDVFNLSNLLTVRTDPSWWNYVHTPLQYVIKDTT